MKDLQWWCEQLDTTVQITFRCTRKPSWCTRIFLPTERDTRRYIEGFGDSLESSFEDAVLKAIQEKTT